MSKYPFRIATALFFLLPLIVSPVAASKQPTADDSSPIEILLVGTSHFAGSVGDDHTFAIEDLLSDQRQAELDRAATLLAAFAPDQAHFECMPDAEQRLNERYGRYRAGDWTLVDEGRRNEIYQLGFRLMKKAGLDHLHCVDARGLWLGQRARQVGVEHQPELIEGVQQRGRRSVQDAIEFVAEHDLVEFLRYVNSEEQLFNNHSAYLMYYARIGSFDDAGLKTHVESELAGSVVVFAGNLGGVPMDMVRENLIKAGIRIDESVSDSTDFLVVGGDAPQTTVEKAGDVGAEVTDIQSFIGQLMAASDIYVGFPDHHIGADLVGEFIKRDLRIYANIWNAIDDDTERVLVLYGQAHIWNLRRFFDDNPRFRVVDLGEVL